MCEIENEFETLMQSKEPVREKVQKIMAEMKYIQPHAKNVQYKQQTLTDDDTLLDAMNKTIQNYESLLTTNSYYYNEIVCSYMTKREDGTCTNCPVNKITGKRCDETAITRIRNSCEYCKTQSECIYKDNGKYCCLREVKNAISLLKWTKYNMIQGWV